MSKEKSESYEETINEVQKLINVFCDEYLDEEYRTYCQNLLEELSDSTNLERGRRENWAAGVIHAIARVNFLFGSDSDHKINADIICDHFGTIKKTISNKATLIGDLCYLEIGDPKYCKRGIVDAFTLIETDEGMIMPLSYFNKISSIEIMSEEDMALLKQEEENMRIAQEKERILRKKEQEIERIRKRKEKENKAGQIFLFDE